MEVYVFNVVWSIWYCRNEVKFNKKVFDFSIFMNALKIRLGQWVFYYYPKFPYNSSMVASNLQVVWDWDPGAYGLSSVFPSL